MGGCSHWFLIISLLCLLTCIADNGARAQAETTSFPATSNDTTATNQAADDTTTSVKGAPDITTSEKPVTSAQSTNATETSSPSNTTTPSVDSNLPSTNANETSSPSNTTTSSVDSNLPSSNAAETTSPSNTTTRSVDSNLPSTNANETSSPSNTTTPSADSNLPSTNANETSSPSNTTTPSADSNIPSTNAAETSSPSNTTTPSADSNLPSTNATETSSSTNSTPPVGTPDTPLGPPVTTTGVVTSLPGENATAGETTDVTSAGGQTTSTISFSTTPTASSWEQEQTADADFIIIDAKNNPCLLANLDLTIRIMYNTSGGQSQTYEATMPGPDDVSVTGSCGVNMSTMKLTWNNRTLVLSLAFVLQDAGDSSSEGELTGDINENANNTWSLRQISLEYNTSDKTIFPGATDPKVQTTSTGDLNLFSTPLGQSYLCHQPQLLDVEFQGARLVFNHVHLMAFGVNSTRFSTDTEDCLGGGGSEPAHVQDEAYTVPLIVACCLAAVVVLIVLGYAISRCVSRHKRQMEYKQMP